MRKIYKFKAASETQNQEIYNLAIANFEIYSNKEKDFLYEDEFYELLDSYFKSEKLQSDVYLFKQDDFFHTFINKYQNKINFEEFFRIFEDFIIYIKMKNFEENPKKANAEFDFDIKFDDDDFKDLI